MLPLADFEARFFAALGALASLLLHAAVLLLFLSASDPERTSAAPVLLEIISAPPPSDELAATEPATLAPPPPLPEVERKEPEVALKEAAFATPSSEELAPASEGYRELLRRREAKFQRDMALRQLRIAALERFLSQQQPDAPHAGNAAPRAADEVHACGARDPGELVPIRAQRPMSRYADVVPVGLFPPRYLDEVVQVGRAGGGSLGLVEMALPLSEVIIQLDEPPGAIFAVGRRDVRCLVGFSWGAKVFPLRFRSLPARYIGADDDVREVLMDVVLHVDGTFDVTVLDGDALPFTRGTLYDQQAVARNLQQRATGARLVRDFLGALFGG